MAFFSILQLHYEKPFTDCNNSITSACIFSPFDHTGRIHFVSFVNNSNTRVALQKPNPEIALTTTLNSLNSSGRSQLGGV